MSDTASPPAAEPDAVADAMQAFKVHLGQAEAPERARDERGRFAAPDAPESGEAGEEEIDALDEPEAGDAEAESLETDEVEEEAADEAQPAETDLPVSWPADKADLWKSLPPEAQAFIAARDGQRDAALNARFQEAAHLRKAHEAEIEEANISRARYAEAIDQVLSLVDPRWPPHSMLDVNSSDYDPDNYHLLRAQAEQQQALLDSLGHQRQEIAAQAMADAETADRHRLDAINGASRDAFVRECPEVTDQAKAAPFLQGLMDYAIRMGAPIETFQTPTTALEWHVLWKAREFDRLQEAKGRVGNGPRPEPRKAQPAVRPGVTTPRSAIERQRAGAAMARLKTEGSIEAGAAALKHLLKGNLS